ncbi:MAG: hypothetical protein EOP92_31700 [Lysobacteraceae bacterium]|nr:MAG: hypothetical protein EOP92_31700 [Xanthomonadaceae bacterium]
MQETYKANIAGWASQMGPVFASASLDQLQRAVDARNFVTMNNALLGVQTVARNGLVMPKSIGNPDRDLTFVPVAPCRIFDTRLAGGQIVSNTTRHFDVTAVSNYAFQGGAASDCGGVGAAGSFAAAAINFTVVSPAAFGYITAYPHLGEQPVASTLNFNAGDIRGNLAIVRLDQGAAANELSVYSTTTLHLVGDIVGYYINPQATALECVEMTSGSIAIGAGGVSSSLSPVCTAGYTITGGGCSSSTFDGRVVTTRTMADSHFCAWKNEGTGTMNATVYARCCRLPGR